MHSSIRPAARAGSSSPASCAVTTSRRRSLMSSLDGFTATASWPRWVGFRRAWTLAAPADACGSLILHPTDALRNPLAGAPEPRWPLVDGPPLPRPSVSPAGTTAPPPRSRPHRGARQRVEVVQQGTHDGLPHPPVAEQGPAPQGRGEVEGLGVPGARPLRRAGAPGERERVLSLRDLRGHGVAAGRDVEAGLRVLPEVVGVD